MTTYTKKQVNALIRKALKEAFPDVKFSVRGGRGDATWIGWTDGPNQAQVEAVVSRFEGKGFDGMQDMTVYHSHTENGESVDLQSDYLFFSRSISDEWKQRRINLRNFPDNMGNWEMDQEIHKEFNKLSTCFAKHSETAARFNMVDAREVEREKEEKRMAEKENAAVEKQIEKLNSVKESVENVRNEAGVAQYIYIKNVKVFSSENANIKPGDYDFSTFDRLCKLHAPSGLGYDKIRCEVKFTDGETSKIRLDLNKVESGLYEHFLMYFMGALTGNEHTEEFKGFLTKIIRHCDFNAQTKPKLQLVH